MQLLKQLADNNTFISLYATFPRIISIGIWLLVETINKEHIFKVEKTS